MTTTPRQVLFLLAALGLTSFWFNLRGLEGVKTSSAVDVESSSTSSYSFSSYYDGPDNAPPCPSSPQHHRTNTTLHHRLKVTTKPKLYHCGGYALNRNFQPVLVSLFSEYEFVDLRPQILEIETRITKEFKALDISSSPWDMFVSNYQLNDCVIQSSNKGANGIIFYQWLQLSFQGKIIFWTPEDATNYRNILSRPNQFYELGPGKESSQYSHSASQLIIQSPASNGHPSRYTVRFLQAAFWAQLTHEQKLMILDPTQKPVSTQERFLIYAHSNCIGVRQQAFRQIASSNLPTVHYGGKCDGGVKYNTTKAVKYPNKVKLSNWEDNVQIYQKFRFCLTMEHNNNRGYITEKILVAFWAGCIPIYWGSTEIFDIFNKNAFIFWDINNFQPALDRVRYLESNRTAYDEVIRNQPILAPGAIERYFSFDGRYGGGALRTRLRAFLGLDKFAFDVQGQVE